MKKGKKIRKSNKVGCLRWQEKWESSRSGDDDIYDDDRSHIWRILTNVCNFTHTHTKFPSALANFFISFIVPPLHPLPYFHNFYLWLFIGLHHKNVEELSCISCPSVPYFLLQIVPKIQPLFDIFPRLYHLLLSYTHSLAILLRKMRFFDEIFF